MTSDDQWKPCESGTIREVAEHKRKADRRETMTRRAMFSTVLVAGAGAGYLLMQNTMGSTTSLNCRQTCELAEQYVLGELSDWEAKRVDAHLAKCPKCLTHVQRLTEELNA